MLDDLPGWQRHMEEDLNHPRYRGAHVRIHDSGDFFSREYLIAWLRIMTYTPMVTYYAYTKEIALFKELVEPDPPPNFHWCYSKGGTQDHLIAPDDRHADVFPDEEAIERAGYSSQAASDLLAVYGPPRVGIPANNIRHLRLRQGAASFGELQEQQSRRRRARRKP